MTDFTVASVPGPNVGTPIGVSTDPNPVYTKGPQVIRIPRCGARGQLPSSAGVLYTAPALTSVPGSSSNYGTSILTSVILCNTTGGAVTYTLYLVESGGSVADNRKLFKAISLGAGETDIVEFGNDGCPMNDGETLQGLAGSATSITYRVNVEELAY